MPAPEHHLSSQGQHSADLESSVQPEPVNRCMDQPSPEPRHAMVVTSRGSLQPAWQ